VTPTPGSSIITVAVTAADQEDASARVDAVVTAFADSARRGRRRGDQDR
jgi:hypothetical protein